MEATKVRELMIPAEKYPSVDGGASLQEVLGILKQAKDEASDRQMPFRAVFVKDKKGKIIGKLGYLDVLRALEPKYAEMGDLGKVAGYGLSAAFVGSMLDKYELWQRPLTDICRKAAGIHAKDLVPSPTQEEVIDAEASLNRAVHQFVVGRHQSLLVVSKKEIIGIIRSYDVFLEVSSRIMACKI
ncbi:MAG: CBS domain-containing protein [Deltaproteobacteria bacterium]|nr:CBS domain-containing protein [Deltaproteobacteria bacterium]